MYHATNLKIIVYTRLIIGFIWFTSPSKNNYMVHNENWIYQETLSENSKN